MNRRHFLSTAAAFVAMPAFATTQYTPGLVQKELAAGKTVFIDFYTTWCTTCSAQRRVIDALRNANPAYDAAVSFIEVDWDQYSRDPLSVALNIPRRSTLVVLKGNRELGRIVAGTRRAEIQALMDTALTAATS